MLQLRTLRQSAEDLYTNNLIRSPQCFPFSLNDIADVEKVFGVNNKCDKIAKRGVILVC